VAGAPFESLDYLYVPAPDFESAVRLYTFTLGGELAVAHSRWRRVGGRRSRRGSGPTVLLASHLESQQTILIYRVSSIDDREHATCRRRVG
jgi:hypothetical protein